MLEENHYSLLSLQPSSQHSIQTIKRAFKITIKQCHPDKLAGYPQLHWIYKQIAQKVNKAYSTLVDPVQKQQYDSMIFGINNQLKNRINQRHRQKIVFSTNNRIIQDDQKYITKLKSDQNKQQIKIQCEQCFGDTIVSLNNINKFQINYIECYHCGLQVQIQFQRE